MACSGFLLRLLIQAGYELDVQDHDGWTPLHAAAHWGVKEACSILAEALCDMDIRNKLVSEHAQRDSRLSVMRVPGPVQGSGTTARAAVVLPAPCYPTQLSAFSWARVEAPETNKHTGKKEIRPWQGEHWGSPRPPSMVTYERFYFIFHSKTFSSCALFPSSQ